jgi:hypothetical protein
MVVVGILGVVHLTTVALGATTRGVAAQTKTRVGKAVDLALLDERGVAVDVLVRIGVLVVELQQIVPPYEVYLSFH